MNNYIIRLENPTDFEATENLVREAFWNVYRPGCTEHYVLHILRNDKDFVPELDFVMETDKEIIGQIAFVRAQIIADDGRKFPIMTFGPISIAPKYQRQGYGKALLDYAISKAKELKVGALCMEGNIDFYSHCGFDIASKKGIHYYAEPRSEEVPYFLLNELKEGYLDGVTGVYRTPDGYFVDEDKAEEFDKKFPPKTKLKLPGQLV
ncbi:MAG: N-acetyltransferase [Clostridia bacterium]|nr:N-acetyltransferase [Clostridia bacterium]